MSKDANLSHYRQERLKINTALIRRCLEYMTINDIKITMSSVSDLSFRIAKYENKEKGLTTAALSKNELYRALIQESQQSAFTKTGNKTYATPMGDAEIRLEIFKLKSKVAELKQENRILRHNLADTTERIDITSTPESEQVKIIQENNELKLALEGIIELLSKRKLAVFDIDKHIIKLSPPMGDILLRGELLKKLKVFTHVKSSK